MAVTAHTDVVLPCAADRVIPDLASVLRSGAARPVVITVGPRRGAWPAKKVTAQLGDPRRRGRTSILDLSWTPMGRMRRCYPTMHAGVAVTSIDATSSLMTLAGDYRPPFGRLGRAVDRLVLHRLADATAAAFLASLRSSVRHDTGGSVAASSGSTPPAAQAARPSAEARR